MTMFLFTIIGESNAMMWLWLAIILAIIEAITVGIVSIWFAIGAVAALLVALVTDIFFIQFMVFLVVSSTLLLKSRKIAVEKLKIGAHKTNIDELIGQECTVVKEMVSHEPGEVKLKGKVWRALSESNKHYEVNEIATVLRIEGVTIIVK